MDFLKLATTGELLFITYCFKSPNYTFPNREPNELRIVSRGESGCVVAESGWFGVNRSKFVVSRDDSW